MPATAGEGAKPTPSRLFAGHMPVVKLSALNRESGIRPSSGL
jgi:hypothetical protein